MSGWADGRRLHRRGRYRRPARRAYAGGRLAAGRIGGGGSTWLPRVSHRSSGAPATAWTSASPTCRCSTSGTTRYTAAASPSYRVSTPWAPLAHEAPVAHAVCGGRRCGVRGGTHRGAVNRLVNRKTSERILVERLHCVGGNLDALPPAAGRVGDTCLQKDRRPGSVDGVLAELVEPRSTDFAHER